MNNRPVGSAQIARFDYRKIVARCAVLMIFVGLLAFLLATQNEKMGFERGHHGWVSSHVLAIAQNASPENGFVGYAVQTRGALGRIGYHYFDRYPIPFSATLHFLLRQAPDIASSIYISRQFMNVIFLFNLIVAFLLLQRLTRNMLVSLSASLLAFSGYYAMFFKDMVHFDQPAILGVTLLLYAIVVYEQTKRTLPLYLATVLAVSLGRAYPAMALLSLWLLFEILQIIRKQSWRLSGLIGEVGKSLTLRVFLVGLVISTSYLAYNIYMESTVRNVSVGETSIIDSAQRRIGTDETFAAERTDPFTWRLHARVQAERLVVGAIPYPFGVPEEYKRSVEYLVKRAGLPAVAIFLILGATIILRFVFRQPGHLRHLWLLVALSGFAWVIPMKDLTLSHNYTALYYLGLYLVLFTAVIFLVPERFRSYIFPLSLSVFLLSNYSVNSVHNSVANEVNAITADFQRIRDFLEPGQNIYIHAPEERSLDGSVAIVSGAPYAAAFYLGGHYFSSIQQASFSISRKQTGPCAVLSGCEVISLGNQRIQLIRMHGNQ